MSVSLKIVGAEKIEGKLNTLAKSDLKKARDKRLKESAILIEGQAKKEAPVDKGILRKYIRSKVNHDHALVYNNIAYALPVHEGSRPHNIVIKPSTKKALFWKGAKYPVKQVSFHHPGSKANPFFTRAVSTTKNKIKSRLSHIIDTFIQKSGPG